MGQIKKINTFWVCARGECPFLGLLEVKYEEKVKLNLFSSDQAKNKKIAQTNFTKFLI